MAKLAAGAAAAAAAAAAEGEAASGRDNTRPHGEIQKQDARWAADLRPERGAWCNGTGTTTSSGS